MAQTTLLDLRFKDFRHIHDKDQRLKLLEEARKELLFNSLLMKLISDQHPTAMNSSDACDEPPMKKSKGEDAIFIVGNVRIRRVRPTAHFRSSCSREQLKIYGAERVNGNVDPIKFWLDATSRFPFLSKMALHLFLPIPGTNCAMRESILTCWPNRERPTQ